MATPSLVGRTLGQYRLLEQVGSGGMGVVYRARDQKLERDVAVKIMRAGALADDEARKRFQQEALALSRVSHPHIATIHDFGSEENLDYIVMEWIEGVSLDTLLQKGSVAPDEALWIGVQVARALAAAHERGIVHRDLKPGNIRILPDGHVKLLDFGLAKALGSDAEARTVSIAATRGVMGTVPYMAPEQLRGESADARTDIWAAGAVLYETATGRRPFPDGQAMEAILTQDPAPPGQVNRRVPCTLEALILKALEKDPRRRFQSARELLAALEAIHHPSRGFDLARPAASPSRRPLVLGAVAVALVAAAALGWYVFAAMKAGAPADGPVKIHALAVLPLENLSGKAEEEFFADGMTEELIASLAKLKEVRVISRTSVMQYKNIRKPLPQIARELNVDAIIEGSVLRAGERVRITTQLIEAATDRHLWAESYERDLKDILSLQSEVAQAVAGRVHGTLSGPGPKAMASVNPAAYETYLRGKFHFNRLSGDEKLHAVAAFEQATTLDPNFAAAHAWLGKAYVFQFFTTGERAWDAKARTAIERALQLDPQSPDAYMARGNLLWTIENGFPHERAAAEYKRALQLDSNLAEAHFHYGSLLVHLGMLDRAHAELSAAIARDPTSEGIRMRLARALLFQQRYAEALGEFRQLPQGGGWQAAIALWQLGRKQEAKEALDAIVRSFDDEDSASTRAMFLAAEGKRASALEAIRASIRMGESTSHFHHSAYNIAAAFAQLGDTAEAVRWLRKTADEGMPAYELFLKDPFLNKIRADSGFQQFMAEQKALWERHRQVI